MNIRKIARILGFPVKDVEKFIDCFFTLVILSIKVEGGNSLTIDNIGTFSYNEEKQELTLSFGDSNIGQVNKDLPGLLKRKLIEAL